MAILIKRNAKLDAQTQWAPIRGARALENGTIILEFDDAEVVMPANWRVANDISEGDLMIAYWEEGRFHMYHQPAVE